MRKKEQSQLLMRKETWFLEEIRFLEVSCPRDKAYTTSPVTIAFVTSRIAFVISMSRGHASVQL